MADTTETKSLHEEYLLPKEDDKPEIVAKPVEDTHVNATASDEPVVDEPAVQKIDEKPVVESSEDVPAVASDEPAADEPVVQKSDKIPVVESTEDAPAVVESTEDAPAVASVEPAGDENVVQKSDETPVESTEDAPAAADGSAEASEASNEDASDSLDNKSSNEASTTEESSEQETSGDQDAADEKPELKLETAPFDYRFPATNQTRHCFTRYIEYHRCVAAKGDEAPECDKFARWYRSLCPGEWVERWNEQRENGTFPGPL